ncbi:DICT sensory domain-containing protein [Actinomycetospora chiangmaiensis]|uniref:DICT sensory domain-containing protein n=1 Tax=Actinomycetospora chiangmaiensis TaxID=402650 RepID=UPI0003A10155|nr:DICT sensory domain-containing protein [Actinomycetospora chiangmaiensis]
MSTQRPLSVNRRTLTAADRGELESPDVPAPATKRSLVAVSHAIESAVLQSRVDHPTVVVALFQHLAYFDRERAVYERLAAAGVHVIVAFADGEEHDTGASLHTVVLDAGDPLVEEWSVVAVGPDAGAFLVATDSGEIDPAEQNLEAGRWFDARWGYSRVQAANELARLRIALGDRLDPDVVQVVDELLRRVMPLGGATAASRGTTGEQWATSSLRRMTARMQDARAGSRRLRAQLADAHAAAEARADARLEPQSGLPTPDFLVRWAGTGGRLSALPIGLALFDVPGLHCAVSEFGARRAFHAARHVAAALSEPLGPVDAAVRLSEREFALVVPGASPRHLHQVAAAAAQQLELFSSSYPGIPLAARIASTVTLARPLPLDDLHLALGTSAHSDQSPTTLSDDPIRLTDSATMSELTVPGSAEGDGTSRWFEPRHAAAPRVGTRPTIAGASQAGIARRAEAPDLGKLIGSPAAAAQETSPNPADDADETRGVTLLGSPGPRRRERQAP